ncbi:unnamed protein product [Allacma fusca]|uniref:C2H2-type domain-containing protein n=1 Tax=Allacma fusca TaxID=39272 RepID=A0A8J2LMD5_9HEXA|nr:unnamed protein product [Allacma fusca]
MSEQENFRFMESPNFLPVNQYDTEVSRRHSILFQEEAQFPPETGVVVRVKHEPVHETFFSHFGETDSGFGDVPSLSTTPALDDYDLEDVFKGWGNAMYHLLWKIINPVTLYDIDGPDYIDEVDLLKLRASLYGTSECHLNYLSLPIPLPQFTPEQFEAPLLSPSQYFQPEDMMFQPSSSSSHLSPDFPSSHLILGNILTDELSIVTPEAVDVGPLDIIPTSNYLQELQSSPRRVKLWETKCDICGLVLLGGQQRFEAHVKNAHELKCICGMDFKFKIKLTNHIKSQEKVGMDGQSQHGIIPGDKIKPLFECDFCDEIFHNRSAAVKHRNVFHLNISETTGHDEKINRPVKKSVKRKGEPCIKPPKIPKITKARTKRSSILPLSNRPHCHYNGKLGIGKNMILKNGKDLHAMITPSKSPPKISFCSTTVGDYEDNNLYSLKSLSTSNNLFPPPPYLFQPTADSTNDICSFDDSKCKEVVAKINLIGIHKPAATGVKPKKTATTFTTAKKRLKMPTLCKEIKTKERKSSGSLKYEGMQDPSNECEVSSTNNFFK